MALLARTDSAKDAFSRARDKGDQYVTRVDRGKLDVERHTDFLNDAYQGGFRLHSIFEQNGNTVMVFERI
jgi:hypothetical protein